MIDWFGRAKRAILSRTSTSGKRCRARAAARFARRSQVEQLEPRWLLAVAPGFVDTPQTYSGTLHGKIVFTSGGHGWKGSGTTYTTDRPEYWRELNDATPDPNDIIDGELVEDFGNQDQMTLYADYLLRAGATVVPMRPVGRQISEVVLDNDSPGVTFTGAWSNSSSTRYYDEDYGAAADVVPYRFASTVTGAATATATYTPNIPQAGFYPVYTWVLRGTDRTVQTYRINHTGGSTEIKVDHSKVGSGWVYLGTYHFAQGSSATGEGSVIITNTAAATGKVVIADAIRFGNGMGDWIEPGATVISGKPREDENSHHWIARMVGQGTTLDAAIGVDTTNVSAPSNMAEWMLQGTYNPAGGVVDAVYVGFHSNGSTGDPDTATGRGARGLIANPSPTPHQSGTNGLAPLLGMQINQDMYSQNGTFEVNWLTPPNNDPNQFTNTATNDFGEINLGADAEMDATIIEVAFHDNVNDNLLLRDPKARDQIARSVYQGTLQYFAAWGGATNTSLPTPPTTVRAVSGASGEVTLNWAAGSSTPASVNGAAATSYKVYASVDGYGFDGGRTVAGTSTTITGLDPTKVYYFRVAGVNAGGESKPSEVVTALPSGGVKQVLIVNGFDRHDRSQNFRYPYSGGAPDNAVDRVWSRYNNSFDYVVQVHTAIAAAKPGVHVASTSNEAVISGLVNLTDYQSVVWILGTESTVNDTFNATEQTKVAQFLAAGGNLFLSGSEIGWDLDQQNNGRTFFESTLKGNYVSDDAGTYTATANAGSIFSGMSSFVFSQGNAFSSLDTQLYNVNFPDVISPQAGAISALTYSGGTGGTAAIQFGTGGIGSGSIVMFGFPFEALTNATRRQEAMGKVLDFFGVSALNADFNGDAIVDAADYVTWRKNNGLSSGATQSQGDANDDGAVNNTDYGIWRTQYGTSPGAGSTAALASHGSGTTVVTIPLAIATAVSESLSDPASVETADATTARNAAFAEIETERMNLRLALRGKNGPKVQVTFDVPNEGQQLLNVLAHSKTFDTPAGLADEPIGHFSFDGCVPLDAEPGTTSEIAKLSPGKKVRRVDSAF